MSCQKCKTVIEGNFELDKFSYLSKEQKHFVEIFMKNRGNIKEVEKELGVSYPTVRRLLDNTIEALGYNVKSDEPSVNKKDVLEQLSKGELSTEEALQLLK